MHLITQRQDVLDRLHRAGRTRTPLLCPNAETPDEMEGILLGAQRHAAEQRLGQVAVGIGFTATYPDHPQLGGLTFKSSSAEADVITAAYTWLNWLRGYADRPGLFDAVEVIPFLDHGWAPHEADRQLMRAKWFQEAVGIIMFDASFWDFEENVRRTAAFVQEANGRFVIEACPDKIYERGEMHKKQLREGDLLSRPAAVERFVHETGVDLIVPNLGTEHRTISHEPLEYRREIAREIANRVGPIQALHGTSSLGGHLATVGADGICKINYYTAMARTASAAVRNAWEKIPSTETLPVAQACGSFLHRTRRDAIAVNVASVLRLLHARDSRTPACCNVHNPSDGPRCIH